MRSLLRAMYNVRERQSPPSGESNWQIIKKGIEKIYHKKESYSYPQHNEICSHVQTFCTNNQKSAELYQNIKDFLQTYVANIAKKLEEKISEANCMQFYLSKWENYEWSSNTLNRVCHKLNDHGMFTQDPGVFTIYDLAMLIWRERILRAFGKCLAKAMLIVVQQIRNFQKTDAFMLCRLLDSIGEVCFDSQNPLEIYNECFEKQFAEDTKKFYKEKKRIFLRDNCLLKYVKAVDRLIGEERRHFRTHLPVASLEKLEELTERILNPNNFDNFNDQIRKLLVKNNLVQVRKIFDILRRNFTSVTKVETIFEEHIQYEGKKLIDRCHGDTIKFIRSIVSIYIVSKNMTSLAFDNDNRFLAASDRCLRKLANGYENSDFSQMYGVKYLAEYCGALLKRNATAVRYSNHHQLNEMFIVYKYIADKQMFVSHLTNILMHVDVNPESVEKLKAISTHPWSHELHQLAAELEISLDVNEKFKQNYNLREWFSIKVIRNDLSALKLNHFDAKEVKLPSEMQKAFDNFNKFYNTHYNRKKCLQWQFGISMGELQMNLPEKSYTVRGDTYQMTLLMQFNDKQQYAIQELCKNTGLEQHEFVPVLESLIKAKILTSKENASNYQPETVITISSNFDDESDLIYLEPTAKLQGNTSKEVKESTSESGRTGEERAHLIRASIVRIMKRKKTSSHTELVEEVDKNLSSHLKPTIPEVEKNIDKLIEMFYLEKIVGNIVHYKYVP